MSISMHILDTIHDTAERATCNALLSHTFDPNGFLLASKLATDEPLGVAFDDKHILDSLEDVRNLLKLHHCFTSNGFRMATIVSPLADDSGDYTTTFVEVRLISTVAGIRKARSSTLLVEREHASGDVLSVKVSEVAQLFEREGDMARVLRDLVLSARRLTLKAA